MVSTWTSPSMLNEDCVVPLTAPKVVAMTPRMPWSSRTSTVSSPSKLVALMYSEAATAVPLVVSLPIPRNENPVLPIAMVYSFFSSGSAATGSNH